VIRTHESARKLEQKRPHSHSGTIVGGLTWPDDEIGPLSVVTATGSQLPSGPEDKLEASITAITMRVLAEPKVEILRTQTGRKCDARVHVAD
jgi:hypothetical protein